MSSKASPPRFISLTELEEHHWLRIVDLWNDGFPAQLQLGNTEELRRKIENQNTVHYIAFEDQEIIGWLGVFDRYQTRWFSILIDAKSRGKGVGSALLQLAFEKEPCLFGWMVDSDELVKRDGEAYSSPRSFYTRNAFNFYEQCRPRKNIIPVILIGYPRDYPRPMDDDIICS